MIKKKDMILVIIVLLVAGVMALFMYFGQGKNGAAVRVMIDGNEHGSYSLGDGRVVEISNTYGYNRIVIEDGNVFMEEADCPDQYCVEHRKISKTNETIVCLPHKLVVEVLEPLNESGIDGVTQ